MAAIPEQPGRDQAAKLRELARDNRSRVVTIASGKGGVGKTNIALSLSLLARRRFERVLLWDADLGLANCDVLLDVAPKHTIVELLRGEVNLEAAIVRGPGGIAVLPAASGVREFVEPGEAGRVRLRELLEAVRRDFELVVIDSAAGIGTTVISLALWSDIILLTTSPEVPAVADAYATLKVLCQAGRSTGIELLVNMAADRAEAEKIGGRISHVAQRFLGVDVDLAGWIPVDRHVPLAVSVRKPFVLSHPTCPAAQALQSVWERLDPVALAGVGGAS